MKTTYTMLLVEDDPNDVLLVQRALETAAIPNPLQRACDGQEAIDYLAGAGQYADRKRFPLPGLVLLDLKMPRKNGFQVIEWMRSDKACRLIPIIVLSASALPGDVNRAYSLGANAYMVKPSDFPSLERLLKTIVAFWHAGEQPSGAPV